MRYTNRHLLLSFGVALFTSLCMCKVNAQQFYGGPNPYGGFSWHVFNNQPFPIQFHVHIESVANPAFFADSQPFLLYPGQDTGLFTAPVSVPVRWAVVP
jgi:hypothetical protein